MPHINFAILNSNVTDIYLKYIKSTYFYVENQKKLKIAVFPFISTCI